MHPYNGSTQYESDRMCRTGVFIALLALQGTNGLNGRCKEPTTQQCQQRNGNARSAHPIGLVLSRAVVGMHWVDLICVDPLRISYRLTPDAGRRVQWIWVVLV